MGGGGLQAYLTLSAGGRHLGFLRGGALTDSWRKPLFIKQCKTT